MHRAPTLLFCTVTAFAALFSNGSTYGQNFRSPAPPAAADSAAPQGAEKPAEVTVLRESRFSIPIIRPQGDPLAVELFVSTDRGANWRPYAKEPPTSKGFVFEAPSDGEYWFASRTHFRQGIWPNGKFKPEVRVRIDTAEPRLDFQAFVGGSGEIVVQWSIADPNLSPDTFSISYQPGPEQKWRPVALDKAVEKVAMAKGELTWWPMTTAKVVYVRAQVSDKANNRAVVERRLFLPKIARTDPADASSRTEPTRSRDEPTRDAVVTSDPAARRPGGIPWESEPGRSAPGTLAERGLDGNGARRSPAPQPDAKNASTSGGDWERRRPVSEVAEKDHPPVKSDIQPPVADRVERPVARRSSPENQVAAPGVLPPGERVMTTNTQRFSLDYDIDSVGPSGVAKVELWRTIDGGANWRREKYDDDLRSPVEVEADRVGVYGYRIVIVGKNGLASRTPRAGDLADIWIAVDTDAPVSRLTSATYGRGARVGQLDIRWEAKDTWLGERPVTLKFSDAFDGPWTTIATGLPNSGQYFWTAGPRTPPKIFLRLEVRDRAGNLGVDQLREAISVEGLSPRGRIRGFRPLDTPERAATRDRD